MLRCATVLRCVQLSARTHKAWARENVCLCLVPAAAIMPASDQVALPVETLSRLRKVLGCWRSGSHLCNVYNASSPMPHTEPGMPCDLDGTVSPLSERTLRAFVIPGHASQEVCCLS